MGALDKESRATAVHPFVQLTPQPKTERAVH